MIAPTSDEIDSLRHELEVEILHGSEARRKMLAQGFVHPLLVVERDLIIPTFNVRHGVPSEVEGGHGVDGGTGPEGQKVRAMTPSVGAGGLEPSTSAV